MNLVKQLEEVIPPKSARAFIVKKRHLFRLTDIEGYQISDFVAFNANDTKEKFSAARTRSSIRFRFDISKGDQLMSNLGKPMLTIVEDTMKIHDLTYSACNQTLYKHIWNYAPGGSTGPYDGCLEHLAHALKPFNIELGDIPDPFNINQNSRPDCENRKYVMGLPHGKAGDYITLRAEMDCLVAATSCAEDIDFANGGRSSPLRVEVFRTAGRD